MPSDMMQEENVENLEARTLESFSKVDVLVNNAGVCRYGTLTELTIQDYNWIMNTYMRSTFLCAKALLPGMLDWPGVIVIIALIAGLRAAPKANGPLC